jgi:hypothetical protein
MATLQLNLPYATAGNQGGSYTATDGNSIAPLITWGQGIGTALSTFGWVQDLTPTGTVNWNTVTLAPNIRSDGQNFPSTTVLNHRGAWAQGVTYNTSDTVTDNGQTWVCSAGYTSTSTTGTSTSASPFSEWRTGGTQHWFVYPFEVWRSASAPTIYIRFEYIFWTQLNQTYLPMLRVKVGTSTDANGTLGTGTGQQAMGPFNLGSGNVAQPATTSVFSGGVPCYFSGDSTNRFAMLMWDPGEPLSGTFGGTCFFCIERSLGNTGTYCITPSGFTTPYWTAIWAGFNTQNNNTGQVVMQSLVNTTGSTWIKTGQESTATTLSFAGDHEVNPDNFGFFTGQGSGNQSTPVYPIWPLVGWVGNPMTAAMTMRYGNFTADLPGYSGLFTQTMYGVSHTYLSSRAYESFGQFGPPDNNIGGTSFFANCLAMRYD